MCENVNASMRWTKQTTEEKLIICVFCGEFCQYQKIKGGESGQKNKVYAR